jgi:hypothetical protein
MNTPLQPSVSEPQHKPAMFEVHPQCHLIPIINLVRLAILAEKTVSDVNFVAEAMPAIGETLRCSGIYTGGEDSLIEDAAKALEFVTYVLQKQHEVEMGGFSDGT